MTERQFIEALLASEAASEIPFGQRIFEPLIGSWDLLVEWFDGEGRLSQSMAGEWHFSRILEGRAIQDVWIVPTRKARAASAQLYEYGTSIRFYDPAIAAWRSTWIGPVRGWVMRFIAQRRGDEIVLEEEGERRYRWIFSNIEPDRFSWRNECFSQEQEWVLQQRFHATRRC